MLSRHLSRLAASLALAAGAAAGIIDLAAGAVTTTGIETTVDRLDSPGGPAVLRVRTTSTPVVIEGEPVCADTKPDLSMPQDGVEPGERWRMARIIWHEAEKIDAPVKARVIAYAAAIQESSLEDLDGGHADSIGLYQMRPTFPDQWGTAAELDSPRYQAARFFEVLFEQNTDWPSEPVTVAAQDVLRSAYPNAYADHVDEATAIAGWLSATPCTTRVETRVVRVV